MVTVEVLKTAIKIQSPSLLNQLSHRDLSDYVILLQNQFKFTVAVAVFVHVTIYSFAFLEKKWAMNFIKYESLFIAITAFAVFVICLAFDSTAYYSLILYAFAYILIFFGYL